MTDTFRALCAELVDIATAHCHPDDDAVGYCAAVLARARAALAQPEPQGPMPEVDDILRLAAIIRKVDGNHDKGAAALAEAILSHPDSRWQRAQPEPQGPTDEELLELLSRASGLPEPRSYIVDGGMITSEPGEILSFARAALARWGRPAIEPVPQQDDVHYAWELHDAEGEWQAGGSANSLQDVQREGNRYLQTYAQDGPHKLIIQRHCVTTIEPVPGVEGKP
jgi:hypothetical protein